MFKPAGTYSNPQALNGQSAASINRYFSKFTKLFTTVFRTMRTYIHTLLGFSERAWATSQIYNHTCGDLYVRTSGNRADLYVRTSGHRTDLYVKTSGHRTDLYEGHPVTALTCTCGHPVTAPTCTYGHPVTALTCTYGHPITTLTSTYGHRSPR